MEQVNQLIYNMLVTKDIDNKVIDYVNPWGETLASIAWAIRASYHRTIGGATGQYVFGRDNIFNLTSAVGWRVITAKKQQHADIDNFCQNFKRFSHY